MSSKIIALFFAGIITISFELGQVASSIKDLKEDPELVRLKIKVLRDAEIRCNQPKQSFISKFELMSEGE